MSMSKNKLVQSLLTIQGYYTEHEAITAWTKAWRDFFSNAMVILDQSSPSSVAVQSSGLKIGVNSILGVVNATGSWLKVACLSSGDYYIGETFFDAENYIEIPSYLGQADVPSSNVNDYILTDRAICGSNLNTPESAMFSAMVGLSLPNKASSKIKDGIEAWWKEISNSPSVYFKDASLITIPSEISNLISALDLTFQKNIQNKASKEEAFNNIADDFLAVNSGGIATINAAPAPIE